MMLLCEVTKHEATGKPCPGEGTATVSMLYRSGVSEQKRVCPHHAVQIAESNALVAAERRERFGERAAESDDRASLLVAERPAKPKAPRPFEHDGRKPYRSCRWGDCMKLGRVPLCNQHTARAKTMREDGDIPADFDAATAPHEAFETLWAARQRRIAERTNKTPTVADLAAGAEGPPAVADLSPEGPPAVEAQAAPCLPTAGEPGEPPTPPTEIEAVRAWAERAEATIGKMEIERDAAHLVLDAAQVPSGLALEHRIARLADKLRVERNRGDDLSKSALIFSAERNEAVATLAAVRADAAEHAALLAFMHDGNDVAGLSVPTHQALDAYDDRRGIGSKPNADLAAESSRERWMLSVLKYVAGQMLDDLEGAVEDGRSPSAVTVRALRAIVEGRTPEPEGGR
jgi:hypothetical protein